MCVEMLIDFRMHESNVNLFQMQHPITMNIHIVYNTLIGSQNDLEDIPI